MLKHFSAAQSALPYDKFMRNVTVSVILGFNLNLTRFIAYLRCEFIPLHKF